jgi:hypothetical protein
METIVNKNKAIKKLAKKYNLKVEAKKNTEYAANIKIYCNELILLKNKNEFLKNRCRYLLEKNINEIYVNINEHDFKNNDFTSYFNEMGNNILNEINEILFKDINVNIVFDSYAKEIPEQYIFVQFSNFQ